MIENLKQFVDRMERERIAHGFRDSWEALAVAHNLRVAFDENLPKDYVHSRDYHLLAAVTGK